MSGLIIFFRAVTRTNVITSAVVSCYCCCFYSGELSFKRRKTQLFFEGNFNEENTGP